MQSFDFIVIGGGSAGYAAARTAADGGHSVAICDGAPTLGGLCILNGCMPSKTLMYSAEVLHLAQKGATFGLDIPQARADIPALYKRKRRLIQEFAEYRQQQLQSERYTLFRQHARFVAPDCIELTDGRKLQGKAFLIATGSSPNFPQISGLTPESVLVSDDILNFDQHAPQSIIVLGGGVVACELAQFLNRIGVKTTLIQRSSHLLKEQTPAASECIARALRDEGIDLYLDTHLLGIENGTEVAFMHEGERKTIRAEAIFNALGRHPNTQELNLASAGIEHDSLGYIKVNDWQQTSNPIVYAAGDCTGPHEIVHIAVLQGECAGRHATTGHTSPVSYRDLTLVTFTDPQIARVGPSAAELEASGLPLLSADYPFDDHGKSMLMDALYGYVSVTAHRQTGQILAAECVGKDASELIHSLAVAVTLNATVEDLLKVQWYHPTLSEIWTYPLEEIAELRQSGAS